MNQKIFREYDIRGIAEDDLAAPLAENLGKAIGTSIQKIGSKNIVICRDNRISSKRLRDELVSGLLSTGCEVTDIGELPTPILYFSIIHYHKDAGVMITGSHNPPEFNGFKICYGKRSIYGDEIQELRRIIERGVFKKGKGVLYEENPMRSYINCIKERINMEKKVKVVVDAGNGTTSVIGPHLLREIGCEVIELYCQSDGNFPHHHPDPTIVENLKDLIFATKKERADIGIGYDGDGDRIGVVDEEGEIIWGDKLMIIFAREVIAKNPGAKIVFDIKCSQNLPEEIERAGGVPLMWKTGHSLIEAKIKEERALLGGEMSGHVYFADNYFGYDDALFAAARLVEILSRTSKRLSHFLTDITKYESTPEIRIPYSDEKKFELVSRVKKYFKERYRTVDIDGVKVFFEDGWGLLRASNTQPILVLRFEAHTREKLEEIKSLMTGKIKEFQEMDK